MKISVQVKQMFFKCKIMRVTWEGRGTLCDSAQGKAQRMPAF